MNITVKFWHLLIFVAILFLAFAKVFTDNRHLSDNFTAVVKGTEYYRINDSISAARSERILLDNAEIKACFPEIKSAIEQMDVKLRQLERYSAVNSVANYEIATKIHQNLQDLQDMRDFPLIPHQSQSSPMSQSSLLSQPSPIQYIKYHDRWIDFQQAIVADSAYSSIQTRDSISIVQSWERPRKFWFVRWGRKRHIQTVTNATPNATITYSIYVEKNR
jgi:hypothetical protein